MMMSSIRNLKSFQIVESKWWLWNSLDYFGRVMVSFMGASSSSYWLRPFATAWGIDNVLAPRRRGVRASVLLPDESANRDSRQGVAGNAASNNAPSVHYA
jgi:hypothetical protein